MKKYLLLLLATGLIIAGCKYTKKQAIEFNNKLSAISDSLYSRGKAAGVVINEAITNKDFAPVGIAGKKLEAFVREKIEAVKGMENVAGSENLKAAMLDFLEYEIKVSREAFGPFGELKAESTEEEVQAAITNLMDKSKDETTFMVKLKTAQSEFAKRNKFEIAKEKSE